MKLSMQRNMELCKHSRRHKWTVVSIFPTFLFATLAYTTLSSAFGSCVLEHNKTSTFFLNNILLNLNIKKKTIIIIIKKKNLTFSFYQSAKRRSRVSRPSYYCLRVWLVFARKCPLQKETTATTESLPSCLQDRSPAGQPVGHCFTAVGDVTGSRWRNSSHIATKGTSQDFFLKTSYINAVLENLSNCFLKFHFVANIAATNMHQCPVLRQKYNKM